MAKPKPRAAASVLLPAGLWLIAAGVPLVWSTQVHAALTLPKLSLVAAALLVSSAGALWSWRRGTFLPEATPFDAPLLAGAAVLCASALASRDHCLSWLGNYNYYAYGAWPMAMLGAVCLFSCWGLAPADRRQRALQAVLASAALAGLYGVLQVSGIEPFPQIGAVLNSRAVASMGSPVSLGAFLALTVPLGLHWALDSRGQKAFGWVCLVLMLGGLFASISRAAWIAAAAACFCYLGATGRLSALVRTRGRAAAAVLLCAALGAGICLRLSSRSRRPYQETARVDIWRAAAASWRERPWLGWGPDNFELGFRRHKSIDYVRGSAATMEYQAHAHNDLLQALATTGIAGLAAYLWFLTVLGLAGWRAVSDESHRAEAAALACGFLALFINLKFNPIPVEALSVAALFAGLLGVLSRSEPPSRRGGWVLWMLSAGALTSVGLAARLWAADRDFQAGIKEAGAGRPELTMRLWQSAIKLQPCELSYAIEYINLVNSRAEKVPAGPLRRDLHDLGAAAALAAVRCHPNVGNAHYSLGVARLVQVEDGRPEFLRDAETELDAAIGLDPLFVPILTSRLAAAQMRGDSARVSGLVAQIRSLQAAVR